MFIFNYFFEGAKAGQTILDIRLLQEIWTPFMKVRLSLDFPLFVIKLAAPPC